MDLLRTICYSPYLRYDESFALRQLQSPLYLDSVKQFLDKNFHLVASYDIFYPNFTHGNDVDGQIVPRYCT